MSNYTKATNFASKDSLSTGDPAKVVKGTEIDTEFNAISSAISSKADSNSPTLTGTPLAPTASSGTNTTQIATTAFVATAVASSTAIVSERTATATLTNKTISADSNTLSGIAASSFVLSDASGNIDGAASQKAIPSGAVVGTSDSQTLTNKTINASQLVNASISAAKLDGAQSGSAPIYAARAWVNFNGISTVSITGSGNVSSITDNGTGDYTINFSTALPDTSYAVCGFSVALSSSNITGGSIVTYYPSGSSTYLPSTKTTGAARILVGNPNSGAMTDVGDISFMVFR
jgi:hypothetical protein